VAQRDGRHRDRGAEGEGSAVEGGHMERPDRKWSVSVTTIVAAVAVVMAGCSPATSEYVRAGGDLVAGRQWAAATEAYTKAIQLDPSDAVAYVGRCHTLRTTYRLDRALADCDKAIELDPKLVGAFVSRGNVHDDRGDFELALADYETAIELEPSAAVAYRNRGTAFQVQGELEAALVDYDRAIELDPQYALAYAARGELRARTSRVCSLRGAPSRCRDRT
jgi:tetratricopeptide (TPR) repeat protein